MMMICILTPLSVSTAGDEYAEYVVVDLPASIPDEALAPGQQLVLEVGRYLS